MLSINKPILSFLMDASHYNSNDVQSKNSILVFNDNWIKTRVDLKLYIIAFYRQLKTLRM